MTLKHLALRTKKSLSGLYSSSNDQFASPYAYSPKASNHSSPLRDCNPNVYEEFSMSSAGSSPNKDSPSRRKRLLGSLRSMGSLRSLRSTHHHTRAAEELPDDPKPEPQSPQTPSRVTPSLALDFEVSPPGQAMFTMRNMSDSSSLVVQHSSPITVPTSAVQATPAYNTPPGPSNFVVGTMPDSPAPIQKAVIQESILNYAAHEVAQAGSPRGVDKFADPHPTPMPGTNLLLEDVVAPGIIVSSPSVASMLPKDLPADIRQDYFSAAVSNGATRDREGFVTTEELDPATDAIILAMLATERDPLPPYTSAASSGRLAPVHSDEAAPLGSDDGLDWPTREFLDNDVLNDELTWAPRSKPATASVEKSWRGQDSSAESCQQASRASTPDHAEARTDATSATMSDEDRQDTKSADEARELRKTARWSEVQVSADDRMSLQDIIRAYAGPMLYHEEAEMHHACEHSHDFAEPQETPFDELTCDAVKAEVEDSIRVMNRSLGG